MNSKHAFDMLMQDLKAQIAQATQDRDEKAETKAKKLQRKVIFRTLSSRVMLTRNIWAT